MVNRNETGRDGTITVSGTDIPFTDGSYSIEASTTNSDFNDKLEQDSAYTSVHSSGNITVDGSNRNLLNKFLTGEGLPRRKEVISITFQLDEGGMRFRQVLLNTVDRSIPAGDKTELSIDFEADIARPV